MALTDEGGGGGIPATMLVGPASFGNSSVPYPYPIFGGGGQGGGMNGWGDGAWIILLIIVLLAAGGGWGNNAGGGFGQPIVVNDGGGSVQRGFDQAAVMAALSGIQSGICSGFGDVQTALCGGFAGVNATVNSGVNTLAQQMYTNQIADMQNSFALQTQLANCCCENRQATSDLRYTIATENCADRAAISEGIRDILVNQTSNTQRILDQLCADKIDAKNEKIADLERQLTAANLAASQVRQTTDIQNSIINELRSCPIPSQPVYGSQPIFTCPNNNNGCGCGCGGNF